MATQRLDNLKRFLASRLSPKEIRECLNELSFLCERADLGEYPLLRAEAIEPQEVCRVLSRALDKGIASVRLISYGELEKRPSWISAEDFLRRRKIFPGKFLHADLESCYLGKTSDKIDTISLLDILEEAFVDAIDDVIHNQFPALRHYHQAQSEEGRFDFATVVVASAAYTCEYYLKCLLLQQKKSAQSLRDLLRLTKDCLPLAQFARKPHNRWYCLVR